MCSWCARIMVDGWVDVDEGCRRLGLLQRDDVPPLTHGICDSCLDGFADDFGLAPGLAPGGLRHYMSIATELRQGGTVPV